MKDRFPVASICRQRGCRLLQLTSDKTRPDAIRFYQELGFVASHEGMKLPLAPPEEKSANPL